MRCLRLAQITLCTAQPYEAGYEPLWHANRSMSTDRDLSVDDLKYKKTTGGMAREDRTGTSVCSTFPRHLLFATVTTGLCG